MRIWNTLPMDTVSLVKGEGCTVWDSNGKAYLDLLSGYWCNILGHSNMELIGPIQGQLDKLVNIKSSFRTEEIDEAINKLQQILPPELNRVAFLNSGSEAVDLSLKIARAATRRTGVIVHDVGYYGATSYTLSISGAGLGASYLPDPGEVHRIPAPRCNECLYSNTENCRGFKCLEPIQRLVDSGNENIAAIIYEPICGAGILVPPVGYGSRLKELAEKLGALLIAEEVTTGMGKTGRWLAYMHDSYVPDILVMGKALGGGFPVSLVVTTEEIEERSKGALVHVQSHQNDALTGKVIQTMIDVITENDLIPQVAEKGVYWLRALTEIAERTDNICDVRGRGLMFGVQLSPEKAPKGQEAQSELMKRGYITDFHKSSSTFRFFPPFIITYGEIDRFNKDFEEVIFSI